MKQHAAAIAAITVLACGLGLAAALGVTTVQRDARAHAARGTSCASCHETPHPSGAHGELHCDRCHAADVELATELAWSARGVGSPPEHGEVSACGACHEESAEGATATEGHRAHAALEGSCAGCHAEVHGGEPASCESCHAEVPRHGPTAAVACTTCHEFVPRGVGHASPHLAGVQPHAPLEGRVHGAMDCRGCHDPHRAEMTTPECTSCHRGHVEDEIASGTEGHRACTDCHGPHGERGSAAAACLRCHATPEPGRGWHTTPGGVDEATIALTRARLTHEGRCGTCHEPHTWSAGEARCASCHEPQAASLTAMRAASAAQGRTSHEACASCHEPHSPQPTGAVCSTCHEDVHAGSPGGPARHRDCLSCHDPHAGRPVARDTCSSCHHDAHAQSRGASPQHRDCLSCHEEHGPPLAPTTGACARCHAEPARALAHAEVPAEHRCGACHVPHAFAGDAGALTRCASCHANAVEAHASHRGSCTSCHEAHDAPLGRASSCASCHAGVHPAVAGHSDCTSCHTPHEPAGAATRECSDCHAGEVHALRGWAGAGPHGGECVACHTPHAEARAATTCESCHAPQASARHTGGHARCIDCHAPHRARPSGGEHAWWGRCGDCHAEEARATAGVPGTHGECRACHQTPGPPLPTCVGCHAERPLGHAAHVQSECSSCHVEHGQRAVTRDTCLGCHAEQRRTHFPDAPSCTSCHPFAR